MKFVFGFVGIPREIYDEVYKKRIAFVGSDVEFKGAPLAPGHMLDRNQGVKILHALKDEIHRDDFHREKKSYAVICVCPPGDVDPGLEAIFFPHTLLFPVEWVLDRTSKVTINQSKNDLITKLRIVVLAAKKALLEISKELVERANRTALLLPVRNFKSNKLVEFIFDLQRDIQISTDPSSVIRSAVREFERQHPLQKVDSRQRPCFIDDVKVEFHSPGSALHGLPRPGGDHKLECILNGVRRLGAQFNPAFHYDCMKGNKLKGNFHDCHSLNPSAREGDPHLNIAPNDFIRP